MVKVPPRVFPVRQAAQGQQPVRVWIGVGEGECGCVGGGIEVRVSVSGQWW
jgi:hypothetical protein